MRLFYLAPSTYIVHRSLPKMDSFRSQKGSAFTTIRNNDDKKTTKEVQNNNLIPKKLIPNNRA